MKIVATPEQIMEAIRKYMDDRKIGIHQLAPINIIEALTTSTLPILRDELVKYDELLNSGSFPFIDYKRASRLRVDRYLATHSKQG